ncbi:MAG: DUF992 domain-containing protein [Acetobacteraceae bacterium]|nr:DUF992 domain-containing protein [Acetobacteraceae bacterium]
MRRYSIAALIALAMLSLSSGLAQAQWIRTGVLTCDVSGGIGLIVGSQRSVNCSFTPEPPGPPENYVGYISKFGLDIGITTAGVMVWSVYTSTNRGYGFLAGDYAGASGEATVVAGLGANVLLGGSNATVALQPLSIGGQVGLNLAVGVANLSLRPAR